MTSSNSNNVLNVFELLKEAAFIHFYFNFFESFTSMNKSNFSMSKSKSPGVFENLYEIRQRYEDTALVLFKERQNKSRPLNYLSLGGDSRKSYAYSCHGNSAAIVGKKKGEVIKSDEKPIQSHICTIL